MGKFCRSLSLSHYSMLLDFIWEGLSDPSIKSELCATLVHLCSLTLQDAPEGALLRALFVLDRAHAYHLSRLPQGNTDPMDTLFGPVRRSRRVPARSGAPNGCSAADRETCEHPRRFHSLHVRNLQRWRSDQKHTH